MNQENIWEEDVHSSQRHCIQKWSHPGWEQEGRIFSGQDNRQVPRFIGACFLALMADYLTENQETSRN